MAGRLRAGKRRSAVSGADKNAEEKLRPDGAQPCLGDRLRGEFGGDSRSHRRRRRQLLWPEDRRRRRNLRADQRAVDPNRLILAVSLAARLKSRELVRFSWQKSLWTPRAGFARLRPSSLGKIAISSAESEGGSHAGCPNRTVLRRVTR